MSIYSDELWAKYFNEIYNRVICLGLGQILVSVTLTGIAKGLEKLLE